MTVIPHETVAEEGRSRLGRLYLAHAPGAMRLAYMLTGDAHAAQDLTHDAFVRLAGRFADLRSADAFPAYLRRTVINLARMRARRGNLERRHASIAAAASTSPSVADRVADADSLRRALLSLPVRQRAAIVLRYYEDLSEAQTADALGCRPPAVRSLVARATRTLREQVER